MVVSNPVRTRLIAEQAVKTDKIDGKVLADLLRSNFLPVVHTVAREVREQRELLRHRVSLVHMQTDLKNRVHGLLTRCGLQFEGTDLYGKAGREYLARLELRPKRTANRRMGNRKRLGESVSKGNGSAALVGRLDARLFIGELFHDSFGLGLLGKL